LLHGVPQETYTDDSGACLCLNIEILSNMSIPLTNAGGFALHANSLRYNLDGEAGSNFLVYWRQLLGVMLTQGSIFLCNFSKLFEQFTPTAATTIIQSTTIPSQNVKSITKD